MAITAAGVGVIIAGIILILCGAACCVRLVRAQHSIGSSLGTYLLLCILLVFAAGISLIGAAGSVGQTAAGPDPSPQPSPQPSPVSVMCVKRSEPPRSPSFTLSCVSGAFTSVAFADFGTLQGSCASGFTAGNCTSAGATAAVRALCVGKSTCSVAASSLGPDPCVGVEKTLAVSLNGCNVPTPTMTATPSASAPPSVKCGAAAGDAGLELLLSCSSRTFTGVNSSFYGSVTGTCATGFVGDQTCQAPSADVRAIVYALCVNKASCAIPATSSFFGADPCPGRTKMLAVALTGC